MPEKIITAVQYFILLFIAVVAVVAFVQVAGIGDDTDKLTDAILVGNQPGETWKPPCAEHSGCVSFWTENSPCYLDGYNNGYSKGHSDGWNDGFGEAEGICEELLEEKTDVTLTLSGSPNRATDEDLTKILRDTYDSAWYDGFNQGLDHCQDILKDLQKDLDVTTTNYYTGNSCHLEMYPIRQQHTEVFGNDMMTIDYAAVIPGQGSKGDIEAFVEVYNPEGTSWEGKDFDYVVIEYARFGWSEQTISIGEDIITLPKLEESKPVIGYFTYHYYL